MKKADEKSGGMRREYDLAELGGRVRGKHCEAAARGSKLVLLDPDVAEAFPDAAAVNDALRMLAEIARRQPHRARRSEKRRAGA